MNKIVHNKTTIYVHHFCSRDHGSISLLVYSRRIPKKASWLIKKHKIVHKSACSWSNELNLGCWWSLARTIFRCTKPDQIHFTMDQNLDFIENLKTRFSPRLPDLPMRAMWFWNLWSLGYCRIRMSEKSRESSFLLHRSTKLKHTDSISVPSHFFCLLREKKGSTDAPVQ